MYLNLSDEQRLLRDVSARFIQATAPLITVRELGESGAAYPSNYMRKAGELGWFAMLVAEENSEASISSDHLLDATIVAYERGKYLQPGGFVPTNVATWVLSALGSEEHRTTILPRVIAGESAISWALTDEFGNCEPGAAVYAEPSRAGYTLTGKFDLVQDAYLADWLLGTARTSEGLIQFVVSAHAPGIEVSLLNGLDLTRRLCRIDLRAVDISRPDIIGGTTATFVGRQLQLASFLSAAESVGAMEHELDMAVEYANSRTAFGRPIGSFQAIKHLLADTSLLLEMSKAMLAAALDAWDSDSTRAGRVIHMTKAFVGESGIDLAQNCFQVFGGIGYTWDHDHHLYLRRLTSDASLYGQPSWHRERLLRSYRT